MFQRILERMTMKLTGLALSPVKFMFQWNTERMTMVLTALAPPPPNFQVTVPQIPVYVSSALQEEDPASYRTESDAPPEQVYSVWVNSAVWISKGGYGFSSLSIVRSSVMTLFRTRMTRTNREA